MQITCPNCGATEKHPTDKNSVLIRAFKLTDKWGSWSQCLVCSGGYNASLVWHRDKHDPEKGWFN
jgi:hypothetical protein